MLMKLINKRNVKKTDIAKNIFKNFGISASYSTKIINDLFDILISNIISEKVVKIKKFGTFSLSYKKKRNGRNPKNKKSYEIQERNVVTFKASENLKFKINING